MTREWMEIEDQLLKQYYPTTANDVLAAMFDRSEGAIKTRAQKIGALKAVRHPGKYTPEMVAILREKYHNTRNVDLAKELGVSEKSIGAKAFKLGLKKDKEFLIECSKKSQFKKGHKSWNKGLKQSDYMSPAAIEKTKSTRFKKGNLPHNTAEQDGAIRIRHEKCGIPYKYIRISLGEWKLLHRHIWEAENGPIPDGHCLWFKDGNSLNVTLENLELITRAENINRNFHCYPQEYKAAVRKLTQLRKTIKKKSDG